MVPLVYFDICAIQRPLDDARQPRIRVEAEAMLSLVQMLETGQLHSVASSAHTFENGNNPFEDRRVHTARFLSLAVAFVPVSAAVNRRAAHFVEAGIKQLDALHLAYAVEAAADAFCTTDDKLARRAEQMRLPKIQIVSPLNLLLDLASS